MTVKNLTRGFSGGRVDLDCDELDQATNCLILSESIAGTFRLFQWSLRPERIQQQEHTRFKYYVEPISPRQVREIIENPASKPIDICGAAGYAPLPIDPELCRLHTAIGRILTVSNTTAALVRYQRLAPELGIYRIPECIANRPKLPSDLDPIEPLAEQFRRALTEAKNKRD